jgi:hypothetical protein
LLDLRDLRMQTREGLQKKWSNWKNQKKYYGEDGVDDSDGARQINRGDIMAELAGKMTGLMHDAQPEPHLKKAEIKFEKTFAAEMESHTCPICLEQMLPPNNPPMILFPCGHTFCKICLNHIQKNQHSYKQKD